MGLACLLFIFLDGFKSDGIRFVNGSERSVVSKSGDCIWRWAEADSHWRSISGLSLRVFSSSLSLLVVLVRIGGRIGVLVDDCLAMFGMRSWDSSIRSCVMLSDDESLLSLFPLLPPLMLKVMVWRKPLKLSRAH